MKKFIFFLILLIILSGAVLYFGWVQIPENSQAVVFSRITGYEKNALESGSFHWRWQKLIPGTFQVHFFNVSTHREEVTSEGMLPSGELYSAILTGNPDFSYKSSFTITYRINSEDLPEYFKNNSITPEDSEKWYTEKDRIIETEGKKFLNSLMGTGETGSLSEIEKKLTDHMIRNITDITITDLTMSYYNIPDMDLYNEAKRQYLNLIKKRESLLLESTSASVREGADLDKQIQMLEKYGELLTKYPILLDYIKNNPDADILREKIGSITE